MSRIGSALMMGLGFLLFGCGGTNAPRPTASPSDAPATAGGTVRAGDLSMDRSHYENVIEMIRGKAPGLHVIESSNGTIQLRIRGMNQSLQETGQEPLVVVDGVPSSRPAGEALMALEPQAVASIQILRDVASTSVYGTRGANGVILVRTRRR